MIKIIGLLGVRGSGKDYAALQLKYEYMKSGFTVSILGFSDGVREFTFNMLDTHPYTAEEYNTFKTSKHSFQGMVNTGRYWLEYFGEGLRAKNPLIWSNYTLNKALELDCDILILSDVRFDHEVMMSRFIASGDKAVQFIFRDYKSERYDDTACETNKLALSLRDAGVLNDEDITDRLLDGNPFELL